MKENARKRKPEAMNLKYINAYIPFYNVLIPFVLLTIFYIYFRNNILMIFFLYFVSRNIAET